MDKLEIKLLLIEDNPLDARLFEHLLQDIDEINCKAEQASTLAQAIKKLENGLYDIIIVDLGLPDSYGLDTYYEIQTRFPQLPCIILSGMNNEDMAKKAVTEGAHDFLVKGKINPKILSRSIRYAIKRQETRADIYSRSQLDINSDIKSRSVKGEDNYKADLKISPIIRSYEKILKDLIAAKLKKNIEILEGIQNLAQKAYSEGYTPQHFDELRDIQKVVPPTHELLYLLNVDISSEMVALAYSKCFKTKLQNAREVEYH